MNRVRTGTESTRWFVRLLVLFALLACFIGVRTWLSPSFPPYEGRLSWVTTVAFSVAGPAGVTLLWFGRATALFLTARFVWRHTPKVPSDRWL